MGPGGAPQKSIFWSQKWHFPDFLVRGSVEGWGGCKSWAFGTVLAMLQGSDDQLLTQSTCMLPNNSETPKFWHLSKLLSAPK